MCTFLNSFKPHEIKKAGDYKINNPSYPYLIYAGDWIAEISKGLLTNGI